MSGENNSSDRNKAEVERLTKLNKIIQIRQEVLDIRNGLMCSDIEVITAAEKDLEQLLERFYDENQDMMARQQFDAAKKDLGYFLVLIEMAIGYYNREGYDIGTVH